MQDVDPILPKMLRDIHFSPLLALNLQDESDVDET